MKALGLFVLATLVTFGNIAIAKEKPEVDNFESFLASMVNNLCGFNEFVSCLKIDKEVCSKSFFSAIDACPKIKRDSIDFQIPDIPCVSEKLYEILNLPDKLVEKCNLLLETRLIRRRKR